MKRLITIPKDSSIVSYYYSTGLIEIISKTSDDVIVLTLDEMKEITGSLIELYEKILKDDEKNTK